MNDTSNIPKRSNMTLWLLLTSFLVPAILAYGYFFFGDRPSVASNGQLINPVVDIESLKLKDPLGENISREELTPKWRMYYFASANCDSSCQNELYNMRQVNLALGKNADRVQHVVVHLSTPQNEFMKYMETEHPEAIRVYSSIENIQGLIGKSAPAEYIYLVDPLGNIMMKFLNTLKAKLILKDINKLLKISRIG